MFHRPDVKTRAVRGALGGVLCALPMCFASLPLAQAAARAEPYAYAYPWPDGLMSFDQGFAGLRGAYYKAPSGQIVYSSELAVVPNTGWYVSRTVVQHVYDADSRIEGIAPPEGTYEGSSLQGCMAVPAPGSVQVGSRLVIPPVQRCRNGDSVEVSIERPSLRVATSVFDVGGGSGIGDGVNNELVTQAVRPAEGTGRPRLTVKARAVLCRKRRDFLFGPVCWGYDFTDTRPGRPGQESSQCNAKGVRPLTCTLRRTTFRRR